MSKWLLLPLMLAPLPPPLSPDFGMPSALRLPLGMSLCPSSRWHPVKHDGPRMRFSVESQISWWNYNTGSCYIHMESIIFPTSMASKDWYEKNHLTSRDEAEFLNREFAPTPPAKTRCQKWCQNKNMSTKLSSPHLFPPLLDQQASSFHHLVSVPGQWRCPMRPLSCPKVRWWPLPLRPLGLDASPAVQAKLVQLLVAFLLQRNSARNPKHLWWTQ